MEKTKKLKRFLLIHLTVLMCVILILLFYRCPINFFFHVPCPGCGLTRAYLAAFRLDFRAAFHYHPLFIVAAPVILYTAHKNVLKHKLSGKAETIIFAVILILFIIVYIIRLKYKLI